ncbi:MAG: hypothetical protein Q7K11_01010 [Candidatus Berkelbacteria bacterium]|nr:hypothetical protein [Candidatus Berkelbacteria bacterium]
MPEKIVVTERLFAELKVLLIDPGFVFSVCRKFELDATKTEQIVLYGRSYRVGLHETFIGSLIVVTPGLILFQANADTISGVLLREKQNTYRVRCYSGGNYDTIIAPTDKNRLKVHPDCPITIYQNWGDTGSSDGIEKERWESILRPFLERYLPE